MSKPDSERLVHITAIMINGQRYYIPADPTSAERMEAAIKIGKIHRAELCGTPRNTTAWRKVHAIAGLLSDNVDEFHGWPAHDTIKRVQAMGRIECDQFSFNDSTGAQCLYFVPRSLAFDAMGEEKAKRIYGQTCDFICITWFPEMTPDDVDNMARAMVGL